MARRSRPSRRPARRRSVVGEGWQSIDFAVGIGIVSTIRITALLILAPACVIAQTLSPSEPTLVIAGKLLDVRAGHYVEHAAILIENGRISRDVENEGSGYADVALRDAIVEGPRMQVATRAIAAVGQYNPFGVSPDLPDFPTGAQMVSGAEEVRRAVREQIGHGADLIKLYADWMHPTLTVDEIKVAVEEAHKAGIKVAAHANTVLRVSSPSDQSCESERPSSVYAQHLCFTPDNISEILPAELGADFVPFEPQLPAVCQRVCDFYIHQARFLPMPAPPCRRMKAAEVPHPVGCEVCRRTLGELLESARNDDAQSAARLQKRGNVSDIQIVRSEIVIGIKANNGVKALSCKG
jgi:hypothetical protein